MLSLHDSHLSNRREWLRVGGLSMCGLSLPALLRANQQSAPALALASKLGADTFGKAKNVIFLWLQGGPPQHETFDPKPDAPAEIRGPFKPIHTTVPGTQFCELLPRTARIAHKMAVIRSMHTDDDNHDVSGYWILTGYPYGPGSARQIKPSDWPYIGSVLKMVKPSERMPALTSVWIPDVMRLNDNVTPAGQTAGFLGKQWEPERFVGDPADSDYRIEGVSLPPDISLARFDRRHDLLEQLDRHRKLSDSGGSREAWDRLSHHAFDLVTSGKAREAFDLKRETEATRDRYGRHSWGQSVLLARRLIEAGVRLVHVNWPREGGDDAVDNPMWDTHAGNADRLQDCLCPQFDVTFPALIEDLSQRGLLEETLVVAVGEFGRTPRINAVGGRDHWGRVFSMALAGAGIAGGAVLGASDKNGAMPVADPIRPHDFTATMFHLLGVDHHAMFKDKTNRPVHITKGEPLYRVMGSRPLPKLQEAGGDVGFVPPYDSRKLLDLDFAWQKLMPCSPPSREKGWRATAGVTVGKGGVTITKGILAQGIRSGRGGDYTFRVKAAREGDSKGMSCWLQIFRFADVTLNPEKVQELASVEFNPAAEVKEYSLNKFLGSTAPGANFAIGNGLGVAVIVRGSGDGRLRVVSVKLDFSARPRDENNVE
ncbi:MAG: DUF1501 domain-containing protein [Gemmataceae bacterium]